ncbi:MAG: hypothetical protein HN750_17500 [Gemmatimonadales bacterium]|jgi:hypothetical protein|nr:hypothetical protein [Gemmatimonadales bacterium]
MPPLLRTGAWIIGIFTFPALLIGSRRALYGDPTEILTPWWALPLIALGIMAGVWVFGNVFPLIAESFAAGLMIGSAAAIVLAWFVPSDPVLYFAGSFLALPLNYSTARGQRMRVEMARSAGAILGP